jgi:hypothetical protein
MIYSVNPENVVNLRNEKVHDDDGTHNDADDKEQAIPGGVIY